MAPRTCCVHRRRASCADGLAQGGILRVCLGTGGAGVLLHGSKAGRQLLVSTRASTDCCMVCSAAQSPCEVDM